MGEKIEVRMEEWKKGKRGMSGTAIEPVKTVKLRSQFIVKLRSVKSQSQRQVVAEGY